VEREDWDSRWQDQGHHCHDDPVGVLGAELAGLEPGRALDLGCGAGRTAIWLAERGWQVTGVDFSGVALGLARERRPDVDWVEADLREYEPEPGAFDLVLVLYVHLPSGERREVLARASRALAPGGTLVVLGHDVTNIGTGAPGPSNPDVLYEPNAVAYELPDVTVTKTERLTRRLATNDGEADAVDALVVARKG